MKRLLIALFLLAATVGAQDVIPVTGTTEGTITTLTYNWTSDGSGNAVGVTAEAVPGVLFSATTQASTDAQPTDLYDVVVYEQFVRAGTGADVVDSSDDLADGLLANRPNTTGAVQTVRILPNTVTTTVGKIRVQISNAGASKQGTVTLQIGRGWYIQRGDASIPMTGGSTAQMLQYKGPGQSKFVTLSGEATVADGGAVTLQGSPTFTEITADSIETGGLELEALTATGSITTPNLTSTSNIVGVVIAAGNPGTGVAMYNTGEFITNGVTQFAGGYGSTGVTVSTAGTISANGAILSDSHITTSADLRSTRFFSLGTSDGGAVTIASGAMAPSRTNQRIDTEGAAGTDDLDTITIGSLQPGTILIVRTASSSRDVTIKHGTGNILCYAATDIVLNITSRRALLTLDAELGTWTATQLY